MGVSDVFEIEFPMFVSLIRQMLRFAGDGIYLPACSADLRNYSFAYIAP